MTYITHPSNQEQEKAIKAFLEALEIPYEIHADKDATEHLLSTEANADRLEQAMNDSCKGMVKKLHLMTYGNNLSNPGFGRFRILEESR